MGRGDDWDREALKDGTADTILSRPFTLTDAVKDALATLTLHGLAHVRIFQQMPPGRFGNFYWVDAYTGEAGTLDLPRKQRELRFGRSLQNCAIDDIKDALSVLAGLPSKDDAPQSLEKFDERATSADIDVISGLVNAAEENPGGSFSCADAEFVLPADLSTRQSEFVSDALVTLSDCVVTKGLNETMVDFEWTPTEGSPIAAKFIGHVAQDSIARKRLKIAWAVDAPATLRGRISLSLSCPTRFVLVEEVSLDQTSVRKTIDASLSGLGEP